MSVNWILVKCKQECYPCFLPLCETLVWFWFCCDFSMCNGQQKVFLKFGMCLKLTLPIFVVLWCPVQSTWLWKAKRFTIHLPFSFQKWCTDRRRWANRWEVLFQWGKAKQIVFYVKMSPRCFIEKRCLRTVSDTKPICWHSEDLSAKAN